MRYDKSSTSAQVQAEDPVLFLPQLFKRRMLLDLSVCVERLAGYIQKWKA